MELADYLEPLAHEIAFASAGLAAPDPRAGDLGALSEDLTGKLTVAAIIVLLTTANVDAYCHNLIRAARARQTYLLRMHAMQRLDDQYCCSGRMGGFLAACAAADFALACSIATLSPGAWRCGHEYEEDFCYAQTLFRLMAPGRDEAGLAGLCARWEAALGGAPGARLEVVRSFCGRDAAAFAFAFAALLDERDVQMEKDIARGQDGPAVIAGHQVWIEGLALLRIAGRLGFPLRTDHRHCLPLALQTMRKPFPGE